MQALILAGGKGSRLQPYTTVLPKPLMPVGDYPILEIILHQLHHAGITEVILAVGHMAQMFEAFFGDGSSRGMSIRYSLEDQPLGTAGPIAKALPELQDDFIVMNGDLLTTLNYREIFDAHLQSHAAATIGLHAREVKIDFGVIDADDTGRLLNYTEKPTLSYTVSMGINVLHKATVYKYLSPGAYLDLPDLLLNMKNAGELVMTHRTECEWLDIGRIEDCERATEMFEAKRSLFMPETNTR